MKEIILMVTGSRTINCKVFVFSCLERTFQNFNFTKIIHGNAKGVDRLSKSYAKEKGISHKSFEPQWDRFKKSAGYLRNMDLVKTCHKGISIWDGKSKGTLHATKELIKSKKLLGIFIQTNLTDFIKAIKQDPILNNYFVDNYLENGQFK